MARLSVINCKIAHGTPISALTGLAIHIVLRQPVALNSTHPEQFDLRYGTLLSSLVSLEIHIVFHRLTALKSMHPERLVLRYGMPILEEIYRLPLEGRLISSCNYNNYLSNFPIAAWCDKGTIRRGRCPNRPNDRRKIFSALPYEGGC